MGSGVGVEKARIGVFGRQKNSSEPSRFDNRRPSLDRDEATRSAHFLGVRPSVDGALIAGVSNDFKKFHQALRSPKASKDALRLRKWRVGVGNINVSLHLPFLPMIATFSQDVAILHSGSISVISPASN